MKEISVEQLSTQGNALLDAAQMDRVIVMRNGKPSAVLLGIEYKDEEDFALERDADFWRMIEERRRETKSYSLAEVKQRLGLTPRKRRPADKRSKKRKP